MRRRDFANLVMQRSAAIDRSLERVTNFAPYGEVPDVCFQAQGSS